MDERFFVHGIAFLALIFIGLCCLAMDRPGWLSAIRKNLGVQEEIE